MGWDIVSAGNHTLDTSNIEILAKQLSDALNINVHYGNFESVRYNTAKRIVEEDRQYKFNVLGIINKSRYNKIYYLSDECHIEKNLYDILENDVKNLDFLEIDKSADEEYIKYDLERKIKKRSKNRFNFNLFRESKRRKIYDICDVYILKDTISFRVVEPFRWFGFVNQLKKTSNEDFDLFDEYRKQMASLYKSVGADHIVYFSDQGVTEFILDKFYSANWVELMDYIKNKTYYFDYIEIPFENQEDKELALSTFNNRESAIQVNIPDFYINGKVFFNRDEDIEILFDDFKDLK